jgi:hypothetical protein
MILQSGLAVSAFHIVNFTPAAKHCRAETTEISLLVAFRSSDGCAARAHSVARRSWPIDNPDKGNPSAGNRTISRE